MRILAYPTIFKLGGLDVTIEIIFIFIIALILITACVAFIINYRTQMKVSLNMDVECNVYNRKGLEIYLKKNKKNILDPTLVLVEIKNFDFIYLNNPKKNNLMINISNQLLADLSKIETLARVEYNKFIILFDGRSMDNIKLTLNNISEKLNNFEFDNYGTYNFDLDYGIFQSPKFDNITLDIEKAMFIFSFSNEIMDNIYYYSEEVDIGMAKMQYINEQKYTAFEKKQFISYIQPKVDFKTGKVIGGEILARWMDSNQNEIYTTSEFIPIFEKNGFIKNIDYLMFNNACVLSQTLKRKGYSNIIISVNISKVTLNSKELIEEMGKCISKYKISPKNIEIEIKESSIMKNYNNLYTPISKLKELGFRVAMDDFGKELTSLESISSNQFDTIDISKSFFMDDFTEEKNKLVIKNIIQMLKKLNYPTVCKGIDTKQTLDTLATINQDVIVQGFHISEPMPNDQFLSFVDREFKFDYAPIEETVVIQGNTNSSNGNSPTSINISTNSNHSEIELMRRQMDEMQKQFQQTLLEQQQATYEREIKMMQQQIEQMQGGQNESSRTSRDQEIEMLRREIEILRQKDYYRNPIDDSAKLNELQREIQELKNKNQQPQIDVEDLIRRISTSQSTTSQTEVEMAKNEAETLREKLEKERKEKEELEALLNDLHEKEVINEDEEETQEDFNLDVSNLSDDEDEDNEKEENDEENAEDNEEENLEKPKYSLSELEAIIEDFKKKYEEDWNQKAKEQLKDGYYEVVNGLKYYRGRGKMDIGSRISRATDEVKTLYNIAKNEFLQYDGVTNKTLKSYDAFYIGRKQIAKLSITKRRVRVFLALDPSSYPTKQFLHKDVSNKKSHVRTPLFLMIKSKLSVKRMKVLISDLMLENQNTLNESYTPVDYVAKFKFMKKQ